MRIILSFMTLTLFAAPFAHADKISQYKPPTPFEATEDFYVIEGAGLFQSGSAAALDVDMWDDSERADITRLMKALPANSKSLVVRDLIEAILLSESNTNKLDDYKDVSPGEDLLTLRIYKLIEGGFYQDALELYSVAVETPHHAAIAKAGILAMLGSGEKSIACLEMKTLGHMNDTDDFWASFTAYCEYTLSDTPSERAQKVLEESRFEIVRSIAFNPKFVFPYSVDGWNSLHVFEQNALIAEGRIEAPVFDDALFETIRPRDYGALLSLETLNDDDRAVLSVHAYDWGLADAQDLIAAYEAVDKSSKVLGGLPAIYQQVLDADEEETQNALLMQALDLYDEYGVSALAPFAEELAASSIRALSPEQMVAVLDVFYQTNVPVSMEILENYVENSEEFQGNALFFATLKAIPLVAKMSGGHEFVKKIQNNGIFHKNTHNIEEFDIEQLDNHPTDVDNADEVYEKDVDAAVQKEHEDAIELLKEVKRASRDDALGETILLSIELLSDVSIREIDDEIYADVLAAFNKAQLKEFSRKMAIERLIGKQQGRN